MILPHILLAPLKNTKLLLHPPACLPPPVLLQEFYKELNFGLIFPSLKTVNYATDWGRIFQSFLDWLFNFFFFRKRKILIDPDFSNSKNKVPHDFISFQLQLKYTPYLIICH